MGAEEKTYSILGSVWKMVGERIFTTMLDDQDKDLAKMVVSLFRP